MANLTRYCLIIVLFIAGCKPVEETKNTIIYSNNLILLGGFNLSHSSQKVRRIQIIVSKDKAIVSETEIAYDIEGSVISMSNWDRGDASFNNKIVLSHPRPDQWTQQHYTNDSAFMRTTLNTDEKGRIIDKKIGFSTEEMQTVLQFHYDNNQVIDAYTDRQETSYRYDNKGKIKEIDNNNIKYNYLYSDDDCLNKIIITEYHNNTRAQTEIIPVEFDGYGNWLLATHNEKIITRKIVYFN